MRREATIRTKREQIFADLKFVNVDDICWQRIQQAKWEALVWVLGERDAL